MGLLDAALGPLQFKSSNATIILIITASCVFATTTGYDTALINGINILPSYVSTLKLTTATKSLNSAASFLGWAIVSTFMGPVVDRVGRRTGVLISVILKIIGVTLMTSAQEVGMFVVGRMILGAGSGTSSIAASTWLAETLPPKWRASGLAFIFSIYYVGKSSYMPLVALCSLASVGALIAAGVTYATANIEGSWSWRLPCALQALFSILCGAILLFVPESPRWLVHRDRREDALTVLASTHSNGDKDDELTQLQFKEIVDTIQWERNSGQKMTYAEVFRTPNSRRRLLLVVSVAVLAMASGNNIVSYYLGEMLSNAGIKNTHDQLKINIGLNAWCLMMSLTGTWLVSKAGRKFMALVSIGGMIIFMFLIGALTKLYGKGGNNAGIYSAVAVIYLFQGSYAIGITPLTILYPPEVLNFSIRSNGMAAWTFSITCGGLFSVFVWPFAMKAIGWETYMINASWDVIMFAFVAYFWIETKGLTLEEIDTKIDAVTGGGRSSDIEVLKTLDGLQLEPTHTTVELTKADMAIATSSETKA